MVVPLDDVLYPRVAVRELKALAGQSAAPLPVERVRKFARRARTYRMMFAAFPTPESAEKVLTAWKSKTQCVTLKDAHGTAVDLGDAKSQANYYDMINKMYKTVKTHCNMIDVDFAVCSKF